MVRASAHRYGIWWHEQTDTGWIHHLIFNKVSETHAMANPEWIPNLIDNDSGVGLQVLVQDINGDGLQDIIVSNKKGVFVFIAAASE